MTFDFQISFQKFPLNYWFPNGDHELFCHMKVIWGVIYFISFKLLGKIQGILKKYSPVF